MFEHIKSVIGGEKSLTRTFWLYFCLVPFSVTFVLMLFVLVIAVSSIPNEVSYILYYLTNGIYYVLAILFTYAVFKASKNSDTKFGAIAAKVAVIGITAMLAVCDVIYFETSSDFEQEMKSHKEELETEWKKEYGSLGIGTIESSSDLPIVQAGFSASLSPAPDIKIETDDPVLKEVLYDVNQLTPDDIGGGYIVTSYEVYRDVFIVNHTVSRPEFVGASPEQIAASIIVTCDEVIDLFEFDSIESVRSVFEVNNDHYQVEFSRDECA